MSSQLRTGASKRSFLDGLKTYAPALLPLWLAILSVLVFGVAFAQTAPSVGVQSQLEFDHSGKDANGATESLKDADVALAVSTADLNAGGPIFRHVTAPLAQGSNVVPLATLLAGVETGTYKVWVRARDQTGNVTAWVSSAPFTLDGTAPALPMNVRVTVSVTVTTG